MYELPTLKVKGDPQTLFQKLVKIRMTLHRRRANGWVPFQFDEEWSYTSKGDIKTCYVCLGFDEKDNFNGEEIPRLFSPTWINKPKTLHPNTHVKRPNLRGFCRCHMTWKNYPAVLVTRLDNELKVAVH